MLRRLSALALATALAGCALVPAAQPTPTPLPTQQASTAVVANGRILPASDATLSFQSAGTVAELLVQVGDAVTAGQPLARLDTRQLALRVEQAQTGLERAQAKYNQLAAGASPETVAVAGAGVAQAQAGAAQAQAAVTGPDLAAAQAQLAQARAALAILLDGPKSTEVIQAEAALERAQEGLHQQRDGLSAAKTSAELAVDQAANGLRNAQDAYSRIYWQNRDLERRPGSLPQERVDAEAAALRAVENGERALQQAQVAVEQARQAEATGVASAEAAVRDAQARLDQLLAAPDADRVAAARAQVAAAEANLARLRGPARATQLDAAAAAVRQAEAQQAQVAAAPRATDLAAAQVEIDSARVTLAQAQLDLEQATLTAPFAGTVARVDAKLGEVAGPSVPALVVADMRTWHVETEDLTELQVVQLHEGDAVSVRLDALPELELPGTVRQIKPLGANRQGDIVYTVVVDLGTNDPRLRWNMTAVVSAPGT